MRKNRGFGLLLALLSLTALATPQQTRASETTQEADQQHIVAQATITNTTYTYEDSTQTATKALAKDVIQSQLVLRNTTAAVIENIHLTPQLPNNAQTLNSPAATLTLNPYEQQVIQHTFTLTHVDHDSTHFDLAWGIDYENTRLNSNTVTVITSRPHATIDAKEQATSSTTRTIALTIHNTGTASIMNSTLNIESSHPITQIDNKPIQNATALQTSFPTLYENGTRQVVLVVATNDTTPITITPTLGYNDVQQNTYTQKGSFTLHVVTEEGRILGETDTQEPAAIENNTGDTQSNPVEQKQNTHQDETTNKQAIEEPSSATTDNKDANEEELQSSEQTKNADSGDAQEEDKDTGTPWLRIVGPILVGVIIIIGVIIVQNLREFRKLEQEARKKQLSSLMNKDNEIPPSPTSEEVQTEEGPQAAPPKDEQV